MLHQKLTKLLPIFALLQLALLAAVADALPYMIVAPTFSNAETRRNIVKRAFDRFDNSGVFSFGAKRFDRLENMGYGIDDVPRWKRAFDRLDQADFGLRRKRSFDRMGGTEFGLMKRSVDDGREDLINNLAESIIALGKMHAIEQQPAILIENESKR